MQIYPEKYDQLELTAEEKSFLRTMERALPKDEMAYCVLHINPRKKDIGKGVPELFNLVITKNGILLLRFLDVADPAIAAITIRAVGSPAVYNILRDDIKNRLEVSRYLNDNSGKLRFGYNVIFVMPKMTSHSVYSLLSDEEKRFCQENVLFKDQLSSMRKGDGASLSSYLVPKENIEEESVNYIFQRLCPEIIIPKKFFLDENAVLSPNDAAITNQDRAVQAYRLDDKQINIINKIAKGNQLILACAGSGKSVLLISKCFKLAALNPSEKFLITCYNRNLNQYYQWAIAQAGFTAKNVRCSTFYGLCRQLLLSNGLPVPSMHYVPNGNKEEYYNKLFEAANEALAAGKIKERYLGVFIDEVQIFKPEWYRFCFNLLKSKVASEHYFVIAGDKSQDIKNNIKNKKAPWQGGGEEYPEYRGKTLPIETNYRNSKPINDYIDRFVGVSKKYGEKIGADLTSDPELFLRGTAYRPGNTPRLVELNDLSNEGEANAIGNAVKELIEQKGLSEVDIAIVLYNSRAKYTTPGWATHYYHLRDGIIRYFYNQDWESPAFLKQGEDEGVTYGSRRGVTVVSIEGALGLDFKAIVLAGLRPLGTHEKAMKPSDLKNAPKEKLEAFAKNVNFLYTGMTRARDELTIILSAPKGESVYMDLLREATGGAK